MPLHSSLANRFDRSFAVTALVILSAVVLRVWRVGFGLPDFLEEAIPLRLALAMMDPGTGRIDWNPHAFSYPSLSIYLHFIVQQGAFHVGQMIGTYRTYADYLLSFSLDPTPMVLAARGLGILADAIMILGVIRIGNRLACGAGWIAGALAACSPVLIVTSHSIFTDTIMTAFAIWAVERILAWHERPGLAKLMTAAALIGLSTGATYPAAVLLGPLLLAVVHRAGALAPRRCIAVMAVAIATFLLTTPYAILDPPAFLRDVGFEGGHAAAGHLGSFGRLGFEFHAMSLARSLTLVGLALLAGSLALLVRGGNRLAIGILWLAVLGFGVPISLAHIEAERYVAPVVALAGILVGVTLATFGSSFSGARRSVAVCVIGLALLAPSMAGGVRAASAGSDTTQAQARRWLERHVTGEQLILQEGYGAQLVSVLKVRDLMASSVFRSASPQVQRQLESVRAFRVLALPLAVSGPCRNTVVKPNGATVDLEVYPDAGGVNQIFYDPALFAWADYVLTSQAVRGRFSADPARYPAQARLYRLLDRHAQVAARYAPHGTLSGPELIIYRITPACRAALLEQGGLRAEWWASSITAAYRERAQELLGAGRPDTDSEPPIWMQSLKPFYSTRIQRFARDLALTWAELGRHEAAEAMALGTVQLFASDVDACLIYSVAAGSRGHWEASRARLQRLIEQTPGQASQPMLLLQYARALKNTGRAQMAESQLTLLLASTSAGDPVREKAARLLEALRHSSNASKL